MDITQLIVDAHRIAEDKGWWNKPRTLQGLLLLIHTEVSEATEEFRHGALETEIYYSTDEEGCQKPEGIPIELADILIRIADFCGGFGIPLESALRQKMAYNKTRPYRHGGLLL